MSRRPQAYGDAQNNQGCTGKERDCLWFTGCADQHDEGDPDKLAEAFPVVPDIVKESL